MLYSVLPTGNVPSVQEPPKIAINDPKVAQSLDFAANTLIYDQENISSNLVLILPTYRLLNEVTLVYYTEKVYKLQSGC